MSLSEKDCYKKGLLWGVTILDVSKKIDSFEEALNWLNIMNELAKDTDKTSKKDDRGMKLLRYLVGKAKLDAKDFKTFPKLINLVAMLNRIKKGSEKAWVGRTKQPGFQKSLEKAGKVVRQTMCEKIDLNLKTINKAPKAWRDLYCSFLGSLKDLMNEFGDKFILGEKEPIGLNERLNSSLESYIGKHASNISYEEYDNIKHNFINPGKFLSSDLEGLLIDYLPKLVKKTCLNFSDFDFKNGDMKCKVTELNKFIRYIKEQSADINKNGDVWDNNDKKLVKSLNDWFKTYGVLNLYPAPELKNNKFYIITDLWKLLAFVRVIFGNLYEGWPTIASSFNEFIKYLYVSNSKDSQCRKSVYYICTKPENCPKSFAGLCDNIRTLLLSHSFNYMRQGEKPNNLKEDINNCKETFKDEINEFISKNELTEKEYNDCLFPFLNRMNCYFDNTPLLSELKINKNNKEFIYKYTEKST